MVWHRGQPQVRMSALPRQTAPTAAYPGTIKSAAIVLLSITIVIIAAPARALREVVLDDPVKDLNRVEHNRVLRAAYAEPDQMKKIATHDVARRMKSAAIGNLNHRRIWISVRIRRFGVGRIDADIVLGQFRNQLATGSDRPLFQMRR